MELYLTWKFKLLRPHFSLLREPIHRSFCLFRTLRDRFRQWRDRQALLHSKTTWDPVNNRAVITFRPRFQNSQIRPRLCRANEVQTLAQSKQRMEGKSDKIWFIKGNLLAHEQQRLLMDELSRTVYLPDVLLPFDTRCPFLPTRRRNAILPLMDQTRIRCVFNEPFGHRYISLC